MSHLSPGDYVNGSSRIAEAALLDGPWGGLFPEAMPMMSEMLTLGVYRIYRSS